MQNVRHNLIVKTKPQLATETLHFTFYILLFKCQLMVAWWRPLGLETCKKVKQSNYRPGVAQRVPES